MERSEKRELSGVARTIMLKKAISERSPVLISRGDEKLRLDGSKVRLLGDMSVLLDRDSPLFRSALGFCGKEVEVSFSSGGTTLSFFSTPFRIMAGLVFRVPDSISSAAPEIAQTPPERRPSAFIESGGKRIVCSLFSAENPGTLLFPSISRVDSEGLEILLPSSETLEGEFLVELRFPLRKPLNERRISFAAKVASAENSRVIAKVVSMKMEDARFLESLFSGKCGG